MRNKNEVSVAEIRIKNNDIGGPKIFLKIEDNKKNITLFFQIKTAFFKEIDSSLENSFSSQEKIISSTQ